MMYDEMMVEPMRRELSTLGIVETRTSDAVEKYLAPAEGTVLVVVNSVCGCAAANARPGVSVAMQHSKKPDQAITVFAGNDAQATAKARSYFVGYQPSSPQIALIKDGDVVFMLERHQITGRSAEEIGAEIIENFEKFC
jgi:putative YphP/YqiW family bacilliredoxin